MPMEYFPCYSILLWISLAGFANGFLAYFATTQEPVTASQFRNIHEECGEPACLFIARGRRTLQHPLVLEATNQRKDDVNNLVSKMGLSPVASKPKKKKPKRKATTNEKGTKKGIQIAPKSQAPLVQPASQILLRTQLDYARNGHGVLRSFVNPAALKEIRKEITLLMGDEELKAWRQKVAVGANSEKLAKQCQTVQECQDQLERLGIPATSLPFLQYFNTWRRLDKVRALAFDLGEAAATLLDVPRVRLYQDSVFWKRGGDGPTPWHTDAKMAPFDTSHMITFWIPLQDIDPDGTALLFCSKSHSDFALPYWNPIDGADEEEDSQWNRLEDRYPTEPVHYMPMALSDATIHSGWTLHCADGNSNRKSDRLAIAITFVDARAQLREFAAANSKASDNEDQWSYQDWVQAVEPRQPVRHKLVPIVWPKK